MESLIREFNAFELKSNTGRNFPILSVHYTAEIDPDNIAEVSLMLEYFNHTQENLETEFTFSKHFKAGFESMKVEFQDRIMKSKIMERKAAKAKYDEEVKENKNTVILGQFTNASNDQVLVNIGNFIPKTKVTVIFTYFQELKLGANNCYELILPFSVTPKYIPNSVLEELKSLPMD